MIGGVLLSRSFFGSFKRAGTPVNPGRSVTNIVTEGPYRYTRNPAYLAFAAIYAGVATLRNGFPAMLLLPPTLLIVQRGVIEGEERYLTRKFGEEYLRYKARVRRWI